MEVLEYEIKYENLDIQNLIQNKQLFDYEVMAAYVKEYKKNFKVKHVGKTYRTGTIFTYVKISNDKELEEYKELLIQIIKAYNDKYEAQITLEDLE